MFDKGAAINKNGEPLTYMFPPLAGVSSASNLEFVSASGEQSCCRTLSLFHSKLRENRNSTRFDDTRSASNSAESDEDGRLC